MTDLHVVVLVLSINFQTQSAHVIVDNDTFTVYDVALGDLHYFSERNNVGSVPTYALKPRDYYLNAQIEKEIVDLMSEL